MTDINLHAYSSARIVSHYASYSEHLQPAERSLLEILKGDLPGMRMLDIGVGAGRTTSHFAPIVKEYTGIDFSTPMIDASRAKWRDKYPSARFEVCDARNLQRFDDSHFDFVLFSFNGIDNIAHEQRSDVIRGIRRICKPGGYFVFSSHNILALPELFRFHFRFHPIKFFRDLAGCIKLRRKYRQVRMNLANLNEVSIYDDVFDFGLFTTYVRPSYQVEVLKGLGFTDVTAFSQEGSILQKADLSSNKSYWIYYLCR